MALDNKDTLSRTAAEIAALCTNCLTTLSTLAASSQPGAAHFAAVVGVVRNFQSRMNANDSHAEINHILRK